MEFKGAILSDVLERRQRRAELWAILGACLWAIWAYVFEEYQAWSFDNIDWQFQCSNADLRYAVGTPAFCRGSNLMVLHYIWSAPHPTQHILPIPPINSADSITFTLQYIQSSTFSAHTTMIRWLLPVVSYLWHSCGSQLEAIGCRWKTKKCLTSYWIPFRLGQTKIVVENIHKRLTW